MKNSQNDVFDCHKVLQCKKHKQPMLLICCDCSCSSFGPICVDCLVNEHQKCRENVKKYDVVIKEILQHEQNQQQEHQKKLEILQKQLSDLTSIQYQFNSLISQYIQQVDQQMNEIQQINNDETISSLFSNDVGSEVKVIKQYLQNISSNTIFNSYQQDTSKKNCKLLNKHIEQIIKAVSELEKCPLIDYTLIKENEDVDEDNFPKVYNGEALNQLSSQVKKLRLYIECNNNWNGTYPIFAKFINLQSLQINALKSQMKTNELNDFIKQLGQLPKLKKFHLNLISSQADDITLQIIIQIAETKQLSELGIAFAYSKILNHSFINKISMMKDQLLNIKKFIVLDQLSQFTEQQKNYLKSCVKQIEFKTK